MQTYATQLTLRFRNRRNRLLFWYDRRRAVVVDAGVSPNMTFPVARDVTEDRVRNDVPFAPPWVDEAGKKAFTF